MFLSNNVRDLIGQAKQSMMQAMAKTMAANAVLFDCGDYHEGINEALLRMQQATAKLNAALRNRGAGDE